MIESATLRRTAVALTAIAVATAGAVVVPADATLVVADAESGERLLSVPVDEGTEVTLAYTHSVEQTPVRDVYVVDGATLQMDRMVFDSYGAGLPAGADVERTDGRLVTEVDRAYEAVVVAPGSIANHTLSVGDDSYDLVRISEGDPVVLSVRERTAGDAIARVVETVPIVEA